MKVSAVLCSFLLAGMTRAWSINGHLFIANIAQNLLEENAPDALAAANDMLVAFAEYEPEDVTHEGDHAFVEASTFADDMKYHGEAW